MNNTHHENKGQGLAVTALLAGCLVPIASIFAFTSIGVEHYSIGGFIPYLMLLSCPIAYLMTAYPRLSSKRMINILKNKLR